MALVWIVGRFWCVEPARLTAVQKSTVSIGMQPQVSAEFGRKLIGSIEGVGNSRVRDANSVGLVPKGAASPQRWFSFLESVAPLYQIKFFLTHKELFVVLPQVTIGLCTPSFPPKKRLVQIL